MLKVVLDDVKEIVEKKEIVKPGPAPPSPKVALKPKKGSYTTAVSPVQGKKKSAYTSEFVANRIPRRARANLSASIAPLSYAPLEEAKAGFVEDLKKGGWETSFIRGKGAMTFAPDGSKQTPSSPSLLHFRQDGLGLLLRRAVSMDLVEVKE